MTPFQRYISLTVGRLDRATPLAATTGLPRKCLVFADDGSIQAIDANGVLRNITSSGGSLIPTDDNVDDLGSAALRWHDGFFGGTVYASSITAAASGSSDLLLNSTGTGALKTSSPVVITQALTASGAPVALTLTGSPNTGITAATEAIDINLNLGRSVTWAAGAGPLAAQRAISIAAPTYVGNAGTPLVITNAATLYIDDAPTQGANMTLTNRYALLVAAGNVRFGDNIITGGNLSFAGAAPSISATAANQGVALVPNGKGGITVRNSGDTATIFGVQSVASGNYAPTMWASDESGTPGAAVINRPSGQVAVAIGASSVTVTNDLVTATSVVIATLQSYDATFTQILSVVPGAGSFVITGTAVAAAPTKIGFIVINPST